MRRSTLSSWGVFRSTLQSGSTKLSNLVIKKNPGKTNVNPGIRKDIWQSCKITHKKKEEKKKALSEKFDQTLSSRRKMRRTLPLGNSQNKRRKFKPWHQEQPRRILVLVKGDRWTGSQASPTTHRILVLVKGDRRTGSQVSPTTQDIGFG